MNLVKLIKAGSQLRTKVLLFLMFLKLNHAYFVPMLSMDYCRINTPRFLSSQIVLFMTLIRAIWIVLWVKLSLRCSLKIWNQTFIWLLMRRRRGSVAPLKRFLPAYLMLRNRFGWDFFLVAVKQVLIYLFTWLKMCFLFDFNNLRLTVFLLNDFGLLN